MQKKRPISVIGQKKSKNEAVFTDNGDIESINFNGQEIKIFDEESREIIDEHVDTFAGAPEIRSEMFGDARKALKELTDLGYRPVFSIPRRYINSVLEDGLVPHPSYQKNVNILAGTIGLPPFQGGRGEPKRFIAVLKDTKLLRQRDIQPRFTLLKGRGEGIFQGVVGTLNKIPLSQLVIIDSIDGRIVHPPEKVGEKIDDAAVKEIKKEIAEKTAAVNPYKGAA